MAKKPIKSMVFGLLTLTGKGYIMSSREGEVSTGDRGTDAVCLKGTPEVRLGSALAKSGVYGKIFKAHN